jgi:regulator of protease activity HflC (stomatin/prohibitin superfamily)
MGEALIAAAAALAAGGAVYVAAAARVIKQYERGVVFRLGRLLGTPRPPGFTMVVPVVDRIRKVNMQIVTMPVPAQEGITRDNVTVRVDAVVYFKVVDPAGAVVQVEDYRFAVSQMAQTSLRSIIGKSDLDDLLSNREKLNQGLELMIDSPAVEWGVTIDRVEIKDVSLPDTMKRSMARQAEADRERRARIINADAELQASKKLAEAAQQMAEAPSALQLRLLQTVMAVAAEKNSTLVLPIPVELLRFLERGPSERDTAPAPRPRPAPTTPAEDPPGSATRAELPDPPGSTPPAELPDRSAGPSELTDPPGSAIPAELPDSPGSAAPPELPDPPGSAAALPPHRTPDAPPVAPHFPPVTPDNPAPPE